MAVFFEETKTRNSTYDLPFYVLCMELEKDHLSESHWHRHSEILYYPTGSASVSIGDRRYLSDRNSIYYIRPHEIHSVYNLENAGRTQQYILSFDTDLLPKYINPILYNQLFLPKPLSGAPIERIIIKDDDVSDISGLMTNAVKEYKTRSEGYELAVIIEIYRILLYFTRETHLNCHSGDKIEKQPIGSSIDFIEILEYINNNFCNNLKATEIANRFSLSYAYLSRLFNSIMHMTFTEYVTSLRIAKAERLLVNDTMNIYEIAAQTGFNNTSYFIKQFKKAKGCSPQRYNKIYRQSG